MIPVAATDIALDVEIPFDIFDRTGNLMLSQGKRIGSLEQLEQLSTRGFRRKPDVQRVANPFSAMTGISRRLADLDNDFLAHVCPELWAQRVRTLTDDLIAIVDQDPDAAFANVHLEVHHSYNVVHHLMAGIICARLGTRIGLTQSDLRSLVAAAVTHDVGVASLRSEIDAIETLTEAQWARIKKHTEVGTQIIVAHGVEDPIWLEAVEHHHEYLDGSGYQGIKDGSIYSRILSLADSFSAMLRPRPYRPRLYATEALASMYNKESHRYDKRLMKLLIDEVGMYPPGSVLNLVNRELAVSVRGTYERPYHPLAASICDRTGRPLARPFIRDTSQEGLGIMCALDPSMAGRAALVLEHCWSA